MDFSQNRFDSSSASTSASATSSGVSGWLLPVRPELSRRRSCGLVSSEAVSLESPVVVSAGKQSEFGGIFSARLGEAFSAASLQFWFVLPVLLICELALAGWLISAEQTGQICFYFPWIENSIAGWPGMFSSLFLLGLFLQERLLLSERAGASSRTWGEWADRLSRLVRHSLMLGVLPAGLICLAACVAGMVSGEVSTMDRVNSLSLAEASVSGSQFDMPQNTLFEMAPGFSNLTVRLVSCLGAGLFEETGFRLLTFSLLVGLVQILGGSRVVSLGVGLLGSSLMFALAHEAAIWSGQLPEFTFQAAVLFVYRFLAGLGLAFTTLKLGLGTAIGAHTCFNVTLLVFEM